MRVVFAVAVLLFSALTLAQQSRKKTIEAFVKASEVCFKEKKLPESYQAQFEQFIYPDEPIVYEYLSCIAPKVGLWDDATGYKVEQIANLYSDKAKAEELLPALSACNENVDQAPVLKRLHRGFNCLWKTRVGGWFKEDVKDYVSKL